LKLEGKFSYVQPKSSLSPEQMARIARYVLKEKL
jgi:hypothetical protein